MGYAVYLGDWIESTYLWSERNYTPKEQETIQKSKDPSVIMTAHGTTHTTEEASVYLFDLDMFVQVQFLKNH